MPGRFSWCCWCLIFFTATQSGISSCAEAQDFRVATTVSQRAAGDSRWTPVADSVTMFHAGKVYDYMQEVGEVVIVDPGQSRFVILSVNGSNLATTLQFSQLQQYLKVARAETLEHLERLPPGQRKDSLVFQLKPDFEETFDPATGTLTLRGPRIRYDIKTDTVEKPRVVQQYLQYADWAAKLNFVLHSGALHPEVRQSVNQALLVRERLPTNVQLLLDGDAPIQLQASHTFDWTLNSIGQSVIRRCEQARLADDTRWVGFRDYQRKILATTAGK